MTPIRPIVHSILDTSLIEEDRVRLRWLREDLTSCLGEVGEILRRASGEHAAPPVVSIVIESPPTAPETPPSTDPAEGPSALQTPVTITWTGADGAAFTYDWRTGTLHRAHPLE